MPHGVHDVLAEWIAQNKQTDQPFSAGKGKLVEPVLKNDKDNNETTGLPASKLHVPEESGSNLHTPGKPGQTLSGKLTQVKAVLMGDVAAGKTSLLNALR